MADLQCFGYGRIGLTSIKFQEGQGPSIGFGGQFTLADQVYEKFSIAILESYVLFFHHPVIFIHPTGFVKLSNLLKFRCSKS